MNIRRLPRNVAALVFAGVIVFVVSLLVLSGAVNTDQPDSERGDIEIPLGDPLADDLVLYDSDGRGNAEIYARSRAGGEPVELTRDSNFNSWRPRLSPDRRTVLFYRTPIGIETFDAREASLWMIASQGGQPVEVIPQGAHGWRLQGHAEWSPNRDELVMMAADSALRGVWITSLDGRNARRVATGPGEALDPSWSPDGELVLYVRCARLACSPTGHEVFVVPALGGDPVQLTEDNLQDQQPVLSPNGEAIAMRTRMSADGDEDVVWDIRTMPTGRIEDPIRLIDDGSVSGGPQWFDDTTLIFHRTSEPDGPANIYLGSSTGSSVTAWLETEANEHHPAP